MHLLALHWALKVHQCSLQVAVHSWIKLQLKELLTHDFHLKPEPDTYVGFLGHCAGEGTRRWKAMGVTRITLRAPAPPVQSSETHSATLISC